VRICRALQRSGIDTIGDLYTLKDDDLLKVRNLGEKGIAELDEYLRDLSAPFS
jgi:DNA-directed RNA polymerase alpha subunit